MNGPFLQQTQKQAMGAVIAPQLRQSLKILQASTLELRDAILEELQINPTLEELPSEAASLESLSEQKDIKKDRIQNELEFESLEKEFEIIKKLNEEWNESSPIFKNLNVDSQENSSKHDFLLNSLVAETSLQEYLAQQVALIDCNKNEKAALIYLIGSLDDRGYLTLSIEEVAQNTGFTVALIEKARELLKQLEPLGLGCYTLQECLLHQLKTRSQEIDIQAAKLIQDHYPLFLRRRVPEIARKMNCSIEKVQFLFKVIAGLDPAPGRKFSPDINRIVIPDIIVKKENEQWIVTINNEFLPRLRISPVYKTLIAEKKISTTEREYIKDKIRSGRFLIHALQQRQQTIERITYQLLELQKGFFEQGAEKLSPLTMNQLAQILGVHETTISRAIANKYILTPHGLFEFKYFFATGYTTESDELLASTSIKQKIAHMIQVEDPEKPYSDQDIANQLKEIGITVARRTVSKYREDLGILSTNLRRSYGR